MWKLGLTGSIGMGKSTTAQMFRDEGIPVWDADEAVRRIYGPNGAGIEPISAVFPSVIEGGAVNRDRLKALIAEDANVLKEIERIVHPLVAEDRAQFIETNTAELVVFDIPLLFETGAEAWLDSVLVVSVPANVQRERVLSRGTMTEEAFEHILSLQMPDADKRGRADHLIETLTLDKTRADVRRLIDELRAKIRHA